MRSFNLTVLGLEVSFKAEADPKRVESAKALVEERFDRLKFHGRQLSKEKLLTFLVLGLADDLLQANRRNEEMRERVASVLVKIEEKA